MVLLSSLSLILASSLVEVVVCKGLGLSCAAWAWRLTFREFCSTHGLGESLLLSSLSMKSGLCDGVVGTDCFEVGREPAD